MNASPFTCGDSKHEQKHSLSHLSDFSDFHSFAHSPFRDLSDELRPSVLSRESDVFSTVGFGFPQHETFRSIDSSVSGVDEPTWRSVGPSSCLSSYHTDDYFESSNVGFSSLTGHDTPFSLNPKDAHYASPYESAFHPPEFELELEPSEAPGGYLEPSFHFFSCSKPIVLLQAILPSLQSHQVEYSVDCAKFKIKCVAYACAARLPFVVRVFAAPEKNKTRKRYAVEFQRRSGDAFRFSSLYAAIKKDLIDGGHVVDHSASACRFFEPPALPELEISVEQARETLRCLVQMASSDFLDVKLQGLEALAEMTASDNDTVVNVFIEDGGLDVLLQSLAFDLEEDVYRCALTGLANLAKDRREVCQKLAEKGRLKTLFGVADTTDTLQVLGEAIRLAHHVSETLGGDVADADFERGVSNLAASKAALARSHMTQSLQSLHV